MNRIRMILLLAGVALLGATAQAQAKPTTQPTSQFEQLKAWWANPPNMRMEVTRQVHNPGRPVATDLFALTFVNGDWLLSGHRDIEAIPQPIGPLPYRYPDPGSIEAAAIEQGLLPPPPKFARRFEVVQVAGVVSSYTRDVSGLRNEHIGEVNTVRLLRSLGLCHGIWVDPERIAWEGNRFSVANDQGAVQTGEVKLVDGRVQSAALTLHNGVVLTIVYEYSDPGHLLPRRWVISSPDFGSAGTMWVYTVNSVTPAKVLPPVTLD